MEKIGYARVSTEDQKLDLQIDALTEYGCLKIFKDDGISGASMNRPGLLSAIDTCYTTAKVGKKVQLVVWRLDRLGRDNVGLLVLLNDLKANGVSFYSITEGTNPDTPTGNFIAAIQAAQAQFEREQIKIRIEAGSKAARARGVVWGRPKALSESQKERLKEALKSPISRSSLARDFKISRGTLYNYIKLFESER